MMLAVTMGDGNGVGPEIALNAFKKRELSNERYALVGDYSVLDYCNDKLGLKVPLHKMASLEDEEKNALNIYDLHLLRSDQLTPGQINREVAAASREYVAEASRMALDHKFSALVTLPVNKEAIRLSDPDFTGHTELIADICGQTNYTMMLASDSLTVTHCSTHVSMEQSIQNVKKDRVYDVIKLTYDALARFKEQPRIAVAGLNAHAGEGGAFGRQEIDEINPAVEAANKDGMLCFGAIPPDTVFLRAYKGEFDAVVCMYHDQGHIPMKLLDFEGGVNVTLGLKVVRTSVDHGTAYDIAYKGIASTGSLAAAFEYGRKIQNR
ncbi:MAG: 4-hydroxythreonine-4-phosphate dehydrogenase PdxA [Lachnospiraceae bacterium]|nr:4-hydroxythreonine-4-phosphate dehydrogenase PdxA [Lachnospiraceae bacterium]